jgi:hypothetical protein
MFLQVGKTQERKSATSLQLTLQDLDPVTLAAGLTSVVLFSPHHFCFAKLYKHSHGMKKKVFTFWLDNDL